MERDIRVCEILLRRDDLQLLADLYERLNSEDNSDRFFDFVMRVESAINHPVKKEIH